MPARWLDHWERVLRWDRRLTEYAIRPRAGKALTMGRGGDEQEYGDLAYSAFVTTYHLKDYLKNDDESAERLRRVNVEGFVSSSDALAHCADLANGYKHLKRDQRPRRSGTLEPQAAITLVLGEDESVSISKVAWVVELSNGRRLELDELLTECVLDWEYFLVDLSGVMRRDWRDRIWGQADHLPPARPPCSAG